MKKILTVLLAFFILSANAAAIPISQSGTQIKDAGASIISILEERKLAKDFMREVHRSFTLIRDPMVNLYLQQLGNHLVNVAPNKKYRHFHFFIIQDSSINAFAGPDGYIGVNSGLILASHTESQLASVLSHEISHVTQNHLKRGMEEAKQQKITSLGTMLASVLLGMATNGKVGSAAMMSGIGANVQQALSYSRSHEQEADRVGMRTLYDAGFDPQAMPDFFQTMQNSTFTKNQTPEFMLTHPLTESRMADIKNRVDQLPPRKVTSPLIYYLARERLRVDTASVGLKIVHHYQEKLASPQNGNQAAFAYGYALALMKNHQYSTAKSQLQNLITKDPKQVIYHMALADAELKSNQTPAALKTLQASLALNPDYYPLSLEYANALLISGNAKKAWELLRKTARKHPNNIAILEMLARAEGNSGNLADAYQTRAKIYMLNDNPKMAMMQLQQAAKLSNLDHNTRLILEAKITAMKKATSS